MKWVFENLQLILVIAGAIAYWLNQRAREKAGEEADYDNDGVPENRPVRRDLEPVNRDGVDPEQEERARQIREEIRRKIAERRGQAAPAPAEPPPMPRFDPFRPVFQEDAAPVPPPLRPREPESPREVVAVAVEDGALERQRRLAEELQRLEEQRREARRQAAKLQEERDRAASTASTASAAAVGLGARGVASELRDPRALRRAFVLREVLSAPVALR